MALFARVWNRVAKPPTHRGVMERGEEYAYGNRHLEQEEMRGLFARKLISGTLASRILLTVSQAEGAAPRKRGLDSCNEHYKDLT